MVERIERILKVFADNHLFDEGVELIGSWCFQLYQKHLGAKSFPLRTQDIDFLIPNPFYGREHTDFIQQLEDLGFNIDFKGEFTRSGKSGQYLQDLQPQTIAKAQRLLTKHGIAIEL